MEIVITFIGLAFAGFLIGICSGLLGIGGGTVMVPVLRLVFGLSAYASTATSLFTMTFTSISGTITHVQQRTSIPLLGLALGVGGALTSPLGVWLGSISPSWAIMLAAAIIIGYSAFNMLRKARRCPKRGQWAAAPEEAGNPVPQAQPEEAYAMNPRRFVGGIGIGLIAGVCAGYIGVGGGFIMVPLMTTLLAVPMRKASGTSLLAIIILAIPAVAEQAVLGNIDYVAGVALAIGSIPGAVVGAKFVKRIPERELRYIFSSFLALAAIVLFVNELGNI